MLSLFFRVIDPKEEIVFFRRKLYRREDVRTKKNKAAAQNLRKMQSNSSRVSPKHLKTIRS
jgi:hypothetical protein